MRGPGAAINYAQKFDPLFCSALNFFSNTFVRVKSSSAIHVLTNILRDLDQPLSRFQHPYTQGIIAVHNENPMQALRSTALGG